MTLEEKIKSIAVTPSTSKLTSLPNGAANDIATFWENVVEPLLPHYDTMKLWHKLLIEYVSFEDAVFMIRKGNEESEQYKESVPADALRRGFLTKTDAGYDFVYNDNDFATYMLAMVLDNDIIDTLKADDLKTHLKTPDAIIRFNKSGKGGIEKARAYFKINGARPRISQCGYTVAHIFDVNSHYYDDLLGLKNAGGEEALKNAKVKIDKGMYSEYVLQGAILNKNIYYRENYHPGVYARRFLEAHMLRFLHPLNYFCAPKDNMNGYVYCEFTDHINNGEPGTRRFKRISGYEHLLYYAHYKFKEKYGDIYEDYLKRIMLPEDTFSFFEKCSPTSDYYASEIIDIKYGNPLLCNAENKGAFTEDEQYAAASYYLRDPEATLGKVQAKALGISEDKGNGSYAKKVLNDLGIDTSRQSIHKGLLKNTDIQTAIDTATGTFKTTLEEIKRRGT